MSFICVVRVAAQVGVAEQVSVAAQVGVVAQVGVQVSWAGALTGMPSLVRWLFILITTGSSGPRVPSPGTPAGFSFMCTWHGLEPAQVQSRRAV